jgi:hypothetical protein
MRIRGFLFGLIFLSSSFAAVSRVDVNSRESVLNGAYERIRGRVYFAVDPENPANRIITDIRLAPRARDGLVQFSADLVMFRPLDRKRSNGTAFVEIVNRGNGGALRMFNFAGPTPEALGDGFLLEQGYTIVWLGWQFDVPRNPYRLRLYTVVARNGARPITGLVRAEYTPFEHTPVMPLADRDHIPYAPLDLKDPAAVMTVRTRQDAPARVIPRREWRFTDAEHATLSSGFEPGRVYDIVYRAQDPPLAGLGPAAIRDFVSYLKYGGAATSLGANRSIKRALGFGTSQSGRFLRTFLYYGFNADEKGRQVFDGVWAHVAGAGRGSFNHRFAQPSRDGHALMNLFYPTDIFPYTDLPETDPETGVSAGLLDRAAAARVTPKIFYTNGAYEYWGRAGSLIHTTLDGARDAPLAPATRIYFIASTQHGPGGRSSRAFTQNLTNPADYRWVMRGLLAAMQAWLSDGIEPPPSRYPRIDRDELVGLTAVQFPKIPGIAFPSAMYQAYHLDFGPAFAASGVISNEPPKIGRAFHTLVPQVDRDGNDTCGIRLPEIEAPLATYTGWNLRKPVIGAPDVLYDMAGSFIPFPLTKSERLKTHDPRLSIEERYKDRAEYLKRVEAAAAALAGSHYILQRDIPRLTRVAAARWDALVEKRQYR